MNATLTCSTTAINLKNRSAFTSRYHKAYEGTRGLVVLLGLTVPVLMRRCSKAAGVRTQRKLVCRAKASSNDQVKLDRRSRACHRHLSILFFASRRHGDYAGRSRSQ